MLNLPQSTFNSLSKIRKLDLCMFEKQGEMGRNSIIIYYFILR